MRKSLQKVKLLQMRRANLLQIRRVNLSQIWGVNLVQIRKMNLLPIRRINLLQIRRVNLLWIRIVNLLQIRRVNCSIDKQEFEETFVKQRIPVILEEICLLLKILLFLILEEKKYSKGWFDLDAYSVFYFLI